MKTNAVPRKEILIAVMGVTGAGKSYFIREVSGCSEVKVSGGLHSCTSKVKSYSFEHAGATVTLVDTPGFNDTTRTDTEILTEICDWTSKTYKENRLLSGIIYLHRITDVRMDGSSMKNLRMFQKLCGLRALRNVFLTTTQWSNVVGQADGEVRERDLCDNRNFWGMLLEKGATLRRFQGTRESGLKLIDQLMLKQPEALGIQDQIVTQKRTIIETDAGQCINENLIAQEKRYKEEIESLERERQAAIKGKDEEMKVLIAEEQAKSQEKFEKAAAEKRRLAEMHADEVRKRDIEKKRDEDRRKVEQREAQEMLEKAEAEKRRQAELQVEELEERESEERRKEERRRVRAQAKQVGYFHEVEMSERGDTEGLRGREHQETDIAEMNPSASLQMVGARGQEGREEGRRRREHEESRGLHAQLGPIRLFIGIDLRRVAKSVFGSPESSG